MAATHPLVVFGHLRWDFVYQRPQHVLSRLAVHRRVVYVEEPEHDPTGPARFALSRPAPGVLVCRPLLPTPAAGFDAAALAALRPLLLELVEREGLDEVVAWLYTPMALPLARALEPIVLVYDCMDELSLFLGAPPEMLPREAELMRTADVVFTGGTSLYRAKRDRHPNVHCFPSSVDAAHFRHPRPEPADQAVLPRPRLGFYGVIDERMDLPILDALARTHPEWQIVLVGPVVKIDPAVLPRHPNLHYLGQRSYDALPAYIGGWDVCLLPFALNDATRFISPTKTLEYMAAERPIVSTPITDVAEPYGGIVHLAETPERFVRACEAALEAGPAERAARGARMRAVLAHTSWDATAAAMERQIAGALRRRLAASA